MVRGSALTFRLWDDKLAADFRMEKQIKDAIKRLVPYRLVLLRRDLLPLWARLTKKNMRRKDMIPILHFHLVDHCNLNCRGCDNFSPLAKDVFTDVAVFERDCRRMAGLMGGRNRIAEIQLLGGEPLLHPQVTSFMEIARRYFPETPVNLVSNGLLLPKQGDGFWQCCKRHGIHIIVTKYPVRLDHQEIERLAGQHGVELSYYGSTDVVEKTMECVPLDLEGRQDARDSFLRCARANRCIALDNGKIYTCSLIPYVKYFNRQFNQRLEVTPADCLDIYKVGSLDEILDFLCKPVPFCRYCDVKGTKRGIKFGVSRKEITEWIGERR